MPFRDSIRFDKPMSIIELQPVVGFDPHASHPEFIALEFRVQLPGLRARAELVCDRGAFEALTQSLRAACHGQHTQARLLNGPPDQSMIRFEHHDRQALLHLQGHSQLAGTLFQVDSIALAPAQVADWYAWCRQLLASRALARHTGQDDRPGCGSRPAAASARQPSSDTSPAAMNAPA